LIAGVSGIQFAKEHNIDNIFLDQSEDVGFDTAVKSLKMITAYTDKAPGMTKTQTITHKAYRQLQMEPHEPLNNGGSK
jgi:hypothetical protein